MPTRTGLDLGNSRSKNIFSRSGVGAKSSQRKSAQRPVPHKNLLL